MRKGDSPAMMSSRVRLIPANRVVDGCVKSLQLIRDELNTRTRVAQLLALEHLVKDLRIALDAELSTDTPVGAAPVGG